MKNTVKAIIGSTMIVSILYVAIKFFLYVVIHVGIVEAIMVALLPVIILVAVANKDEIY